MDRISLTLALSILIFALLPNPGPQDVNAQEEQTDQTSIHRFTMNFKTLGGQQFWTDLRIVGGWKIQRNALDDHCRLIDREHYRVAWGSYAKCLTALDERIAAEQIHPYEGEVVILLHGLMRSHRSLNRIAKFLREKSDYEVIQFEYASSRKEVAYHAKALQQVIDGLGSGVTKIHFVGHSLGSIVVRKMLGDLTEKPCDPPDARFGRMVMLGPPNQGSRLARVLKYSLLFTTIAGVGGVQLSTTWKALEPELETPEFEFGIIAGGQNSERRWSNFILKGADDFTVSVRETRLVGAADFLVRPLLHGTMMNQPEVLEATLRFLRKGYFVSEALQTPIASLKDE